MAKQCLLLVLFANAFCAEACHVTNSKFTVDVNKYRHNDNSDKRIFGGASLCALKGLVFS